MIELYGADRVNRGFNCACHVPESKVRRSVESKRVEPIAAAVMPANSTIRVDTRRRRRDRGLIVDGRRRCDACIARAALRH